jgi:hypothetical protein
MRGTLALVALVGLASCSPPLPEWRQVDRVERALAANACIGSLDRWDRRYFYALGRERSGPFGRREVDRDVIGFKFDEAGVGDYRSLRRVGHVEQFTTYDHRQRRSAAGAYDLRRGRLDLWSCGLTCGPDVPAGGSCG